MARKNKLKKHGGIPSKSSRLNSSGRVHMKQRKLSSSHMKRLENMCMRNGKRIIDDITIFFNGILMWNNGIPSENNLYDWDDGWIT